MKIRNGFVSNSSSTSFIVHKSDVREWDEFIKKITQAEEDYKHSGENANYEFFVNIQGNYIAIEMYGSPNSVEKAIEEHVIGKGMFIQN